MISPFHIKPNNIISKQYGERGEIEYGWSNNIKDWILQFYFQLIRCNNTYLDNLETRLRDMLYYLMNVIRISPKIIKDEYKCYLILLFKMIGQTRDIVDGKGERNLTYMMITVWYDFYPELAFFALNCLNDDLYFQHTYGSWKDIKYFCNYCKEKKGNEGHPLIKECIKIVNFQLILDYYSINKISLLAKWIPREKSKKFGWLFCYLAYDYFNYYIQSAKNLYSLYNAKNKCKSNYRTMISYLNAKIGTLERLQCSHQWSSINFNNITSLALHNQKKAFLKDDGDEDRKNCRENFKNYILNTNHQRIKINCKHIGMNNFTKNACNLLNELKKKNETENWELEKDFLNQQWKENSLSTNDLGYIIPIIDISSSMLGDPLDAAIALGIRVAEKSSLGKRIIILGSSATCVNLEDKTTFVEMVQEIRKNELGINSNLYSGLDLIVDAILETKMEPSQVHNLSIIIFSDMQVDSLNSIYQTSLFEKIKEKFVNAGIRLHKKPFNVPHLIFWNLRSTNGFPCLSRENNTTMLSGYSSTLLNRLSKQGLNILGEKNPWFSLQEILNNKRYSILEDKAREIVNK